MRAVPVVALLTCVCASRRPSTVNTLLKETFPRMGVFTLLMGRRAGRGGDSVDDGDDGVDRGVIVVVVVIDVIPPAADAFSPPLAPLPFPFPLPLPPLPRPRDVPLRHMLPPLAHLPHAHLHVQEERHPPPPPPTQARSCSTAGGKAASCRRGGDDELSEGPQGLVLGGETSASKRSSRKALVSLVPPVRICSPLAMGVCLLLPPHD